LQQLPLGVVGAAISVALLPVLSKALKAGAIEEARQTQDKAVEYGLLLSLPAAALLIALAQPIVMFLFQHGKFTGSDATMTAYAVMAYAVGLPCYVMTKALMPNFFARGDTITPVKYSAVVFATNFIFNLLLMRFFGHVGIALATTIAAFVSLGQYLHGLKKRGYWQISAKLLQKMAKISLVSVLGGVAAWGANYALILCWPQYLLHKWSLFIGLAGIGIFALAILLIFATIASVWDIRTIINLIRKKHG
jgi:putative peptidoglycan lipid II flippase